MSLLFIIMPAAAAIVLHELGHIIAVYALGGRIEKIRLSPFGLTMIKSGKNFSYWRDALAALAGCIADLIAAATVYGARGGSMFVRASVFYALFNLLPVSTLDGGSALYSIVCIFARDEKTAGRVLKITSGVTLILLWAVGIFMILRPECSPSLFFMSLYLFCSLYLR